MEQYGKILLIAMPAFLLLVFLEKWYGWRKGNDTVENMDMISSLCSGVTNATKDVLGLSIAILSYDWLLQHVAVTHLKTSWVLYFIAFIVLDFSGYLVHLLDHKINFFWNSHLIHHSSQEFNLACALRQSIAVFVKLFIILLLPAALFGVPSIIIATIAPLHLFAQFWYHTKHIGKMGILEFIIVTPSHHRVHHAINKEYIDKNLGQILIIWDKIFGTFQTELKDTPPIYGITIPVQTWNPIKINFIHLCQLFKDAYQTKSWKDKLLIWIKPTGWRPSDVNNQFPLHKINDIYHFKKYQTIHSKNTLVWFWFQIFMLLLFVSYLFGNIAVIGIPNIYLYGLFVMLYVYSFTELMDGSKFSFIWELVKNIFAIIFIIYNGSWFGADKILGLSNSIFIIYFLISTIIIFGLTKKLHQ